MDVAADSYPQPHADREVIAGRKIDWTGRDVMAGLAWFVGLFIFGQIATLPFLIAYGDTSSEFYVSAFVLSAAVEVSIVLVAAHFTFRKYGGSWFRLGFASIDGMTLVWALGAFVAAFAASAAYGVIINVLNLDFLKSSCAEQIPKEVRSDRAVLALASLVVILFAPICEEIFFRGFIFTGLAKLWGLVPGILASAFLFSLAHLLYKSFVPIALVGMIFAFTYHRSRNIASTMMAHMAFNSLSIAFIAGGSCDTNSSISSAWLSGAHSLAATVLPHLHFR